MNAVELLPTDGPLPWVCVQRAGTNNVHPGARYFRANLRELVASYASKPWIGHDEIRRHAASITALCFADEADLEGFVAELARVTAPNRSGRAVVVLLRQIFASILATLRARASSPN